MNEHTNPHENPKLHLHADPRIQEMKSMLDRLARRDGEAMPPGATARLMEAVSGAMAPAPIVIERAQAERSDRAPGRGIGRLRYAAGALLATGVTLTILAARTWDSSPPVPERPASNGNWSLASFERDLDEYLDLETVDDGRLSDAVAEWEIWAQAVGTDIESSMYGGDLYTPTSDEGAL